MYQADIADFEKANVSLYIAYSKSQVSLDFLSDILKVRSGATNEMGTIIDAQVKKDERVVKEYSSSYSQTSDRFLIKVKGSLYLSMLKKSASVFNSDSSFFFVYTDDFKEYTEMISESTKKKLKYLNISLAFLNRKNMAYLFKDIDISADLYKYLYKNYYSSIDGVFELRKQMLAGATVEKKKDISDICGYPKITLKKVAFQLLTTGMYSDKAKKVYVRNRCQMMLSVSQEYSKDIDTFRRFLLVVVNDFITIKTLYLKGKEYRVRKDIDENEKEIVNKYKNDLDQIENIPLMKLTVLKKVLMEKRWFNDSDIVKSIYRLSSEMSFWRF